LKNITNALQTPRMHNNKEAMHSNKVTLSFFFFFFKMWKRSHCISNSYVVVLLPIFKSNFLNFFSSNTTYQPNPILYIKLLVCACVRAFVTVSRACVYDRQSWELNIEVLRARSWEPNAAIRQQQKKRVVASNRIVWLLKLEMMVDVDTATQGFLGRYQYIKNLLKKRRRGY
jgi:hypothetical protein